MEPSTCCALTPGSGGRYGRSSGKTLLEIRKVQADVMLRARGIGNYGDYYTPEGFVPGSKEATDIPWFVIHKLGPSFSYEPDPARYKSSE